MVKILVKDKVFKLKVNCDAKDTEFVDLFYCKISKIAAEGLLKEYQY